MELSKGWRGSQMLVELIDPSSMIPVRPPEVLLTKLTSRSTQAELANLTGPSELKGAQVSSASRGLYSLRRSREIILEVPGTSCQERASSGSPVRVCNMVVQDPRAIVKGASRNCHFLVTYFFGMGCAGVTCEASPRRDRMKNSPAEDSASFVARTIRKRRRVIVSIHILVTLRHIHNRQTHGSET